jgi:hypothetical protein
MMALSLQVGKYRSATEVHSSHTFGVSFLTLKTRIDLYTLHRN